MDILYSTDLSGPKQWVEGVRWKGGGGGARDERGGSEGYVHVKVYTETGEGWGKAERHGQDGKRNDSL